MVISLSGTKKAAPNGLTAEELQESPRRTAHRRRRLPGTPADHRFQPVRSASGDPLTSPKQSGLRGRRLYFILVLAYCIVS